MAGEVTAHPLPPSPLATLPPPAPPNPTLLLKSHLSALRSSLSLRPSPFHPLPPTLVSPPVPPPSTTLASLLALLSFLLPSVTVGKILHTLPNLTHHAGTSRSFYTSPSSLGTVPYLILPNFCSCPSHSHATHNGHNGMCKHLWAVELLDVLEALERKEIARRVLEENVEEEVAKMLLT